MNKKNKKNKKIILGSASPRRRELLTQIGVEFEVMSSDGEERYISTEPEEIVKELALEKAENVAAVLEQKENCLVIGADTIVALDEEILGKPRDEEDAFRTLENLQGRAHQVYTGTAILDYDAEGKKTVICHAERTEVFVHAMTDAEILKYIATKEPLDKAGSYGIQGGFAAYIDRIEGDYYNVVGLPVAYLYQQLKRLGAIEE